jgi:protein-tyrosine-phosphatase
MTSRPRQFKLRIWWLALGYFLFYAPYSFFIRILTTRNWPGVDEHVSGFQMLPAVAISTALVLFAFVSLKGWWKYSSRRRGIGLNIPFPNRLLILSGLGTAIIIGTTTLNFTFTGISIVFALLLMRGGVLIMAPVVDRAFNRRVRWFSWAALAVAGIAILLALADVTNYQLTLVAALTVAAYLSGYLLRLPCITNEAKSYDSSITYRYFVDEALVAMFFLVSIPLVFALIGKGEIMLELRHGFTQFFVSSVTLPSLLIGALYAGLYYFGTLVYLDCRENTYCIPLNRASSLLAGVASSFAMALLLDQGLPSGAQLIAALLIVLALLLLSPFHHVIERIPDNLALALAGARRKLVPGLQPDTATRERLFLFVCSGNTCRSPMAAAIGNAEIAMRLNIPYEAMETVNARAISAGVAARVGAPMTAEAIEALGSLNVSPGRHAARNLTPELAEKAEMIFCMTSAHRKAVIEMIPSVAGKTFCLDPEVDIADPIGGPLEAYMRCAQQIQRLVRWRLAEVQWGVST